MRPRRQGSSGVQERVGRTEHTGSPHGREVNLGHHRHLSQTEADPEPDHSCGSLLWGQRFPILSFLSPVYPPSGPPCSEHGTLRTPACPQVWGREPSPTLQIHIAITLEDLSFPDLVSLARPASRRLFTQPPISSYLPLC